MPGNARPGGPPTGLTLEQARSILAQDGPNRLPGIRTVPVWQQLLGQFLHFFALMLWAAAALAAVGGMPQLGAAIAGVVVINGVFAFAQEYRAERAGQRLTELMPTRTRVRRSGGEMTIPATEVVRGDLVVLGEGDRIPADGLCAETVGLAIDTAALTGESVPEAPAAGDELAAGCYVLAGAGQMRVTATGANTRFAGIAALTSAPKRQRTPLERDIRRLVRTVAVIALAVGSLFFAVMLTLGMSPGQGFIFAIGVTVALVPEALLPTVTLSLALGAQAMSREHALVRRLESVETLGATTMICTDKTGTLTQNRLSVTTVWTPHGIATITGEGYAPGGSVCVTAAGRAAVAECAAAARDASRGRVEDRAGEWVPHGDPLDAAVAVLAQRMGLQPASDDEVDFVPFDPVRRAAESVRTDRVCVKGAPEAVLPRCAAVPDGAPAAISTMTGRGQRVLAVARGPAGAVGGGGLELLGLLGCSDPPRDGVATAIGQCRRAGIRLAMVTGDHPATARAIAADVGLTLPASPVLTGADLPSDEEALGAAVDHDGIVLARITPEDKYRIARALRARGHIVAMTGDGVNDAPALREADIGVAMGRGGTDVAREAADLVLLDDHFATIVAAVRQGRSTFLNTRRFLTYHLTDNVAELAPFLVWGASAGTVPLALGVLQILALDLGTDTLPAAALGAEQPSARVLDRPPVTGALLDRTTAIRAFGILGPLEAVCELAVFATVLLGTGWHPGSTLGAGQSATASGAAFMTVVVMQMANAAACRSTSLPVWRVGARNRFLLAALLFTAAFAGASLLLPPVASALGQLPPPPAVLPLIAMSGVLLLGVDAVWKGLRRRWRSVRR